MEKCFNWTGRKTCGLIARARQALNVSHNPMLRERGVQQPPQADEMIEPSLADLQERAWLLGNDTLTVTDSGQEHLRRQMREGRGERCTTTKTATDAESVSN